MKYYSNAQLRRGMDNMYQMERQARKKLEYAMAALKSIAEGEEPRTETERTEETEGTESAGTEDAAREDRVELTREEMIAAAKTALAELNTRKDW